MNKNSKIYIAGHRGMVGSAIYRKLNEIGYTNIVMRTHKELDLTRQRETEEFFMQERPEYVFLAAAKVGGIMANSTYKADFIYQNIIIAANIVDASYKHGVKKLLNLGSTCIYPKHAQQPLKEESLLTGALEPTNDAYAIAKISAIKLCRHYNEQYGTNFLSCMPTNMYGPNDNYNLDTSHVLPALIRKMHLGKLLWQEKYKEIISDFIWNKEIEGVSVLDSSSDMIEHCLKLTANYGITKDCITLWGSGTPYREFLYADDLAEACLFLMEKFNAQDLGEFVNIGMSKDDTINDIAMMIKEITNYEGTLEWDTTKLDGTPKKLSDVSRINALGWKAKIGLEEGIKLAYEDYMCRAKENKASSTVG